MLANKILSTSVFVTSAQRIGFLSHASAFQICSNLINTIATQKDFFHRYQMFALAHKAAGRVISS